MIMTLKERYNVVTGWFEANMPVAESELVFESPYQLLVAVMLSAQCTDKRVNMVTPALFLRYPTVADLAVAEFDEVLGLISSISFPNNKACHLIAMAQRVVSHYGGEIPTDVDELQTLQGVGRKTANVLASIVAQSPVIAVDTHVFRVSHRLGLSKGKTPTAVELDLERHIAPELRPKAHHWLILFGRYTCTARKPKCVTCAFRPFCTYKD